MEMGISEALAIVLELAKANIIRDPDMLEETERQEMACKLAQEWFDTKFGD